MRAVFLGGSSGARIRAAGRAGRLVIPVTALLCLIAPAVLSTYWIRILTTICLSGVLASALNIIAGYTGYPAFGNVVFFGLGSYITAVTMSRLDLPFWSGLALSAAVSSLSAAIVGIPVLRLRGHYFAIATLGMNQMARALIENLRFTGGGMGLSLPSVQGDPRAVNTYFYFLLLGLLAMVVVVSAWMSQHRFGLGCLAIRYDEEAAACSGVPTQAYKILAWILSAAFTGAAGAIYAYWVGYIEPGAVFDMTIAVKAFVMMLLGGSAGVFGPLLGAAVVELIGLGAWSTFLVYHSAVLGMLLVLVVLFMPGGLLGGAQGRPTGTLLRKSDGR